MNIQQRTIQAHQSYQVSNKISDETLMKVFSNSKRVKKTNIKQADQQFVWKRANTSYGILFKDYFQEHNTKRKTSDISKQELLQVLHLTQRKATKQLNCSLSILKRRFYELKSDLGLKCWPQTYDEICHLPIFPKIYPLSLSFILNDSNSQ